MTRRRLWGMMAPLAVWLAVVVALWLLQHWWIGSAEERVKARQAAAAAAALDGCTRRALRASMLACMPPPSKLPSAPRRPSTRPSASTSTTRAPASSPTRLRWSVGCSAARAVPGAACGAFKSALSRRPPARQRWRLVASPSPRLPPCLPCHPTQVANDQDWDSPETDALRALLVGGLPARAASAACGLARPAHPPCHPSTSRSCRRKSLPRACASTPTPCCTGATTSTARWTTRRTTKRVGGRRCGRGPAGGREDRGAGVPRRAPGCVRRSTGPPLAILRACCPFRL